MIKVVSPLLRLSVRCFGLRRPDNSKVDVKKILRAERPKARPAASEKKVKATSPYYYHIVCRIEETPKEESKEEGPLAGMDDFIDKIFLESNWTDLDKLNSYTKYDHTMRRQVYRSKDMDKIVAKVNETHPIGDDEMRANFMPCLRSFSIRANLAEMEEKTGTAEITLRSTFAPRKKIPMPAESPLDITSSHFEINRINDVAASKYLFKGLFKIANSLMSGGGKEEVEEAEEDYPASLFTYYETLPQWAQKNQAIRNVLVGLEFFKPEIPMWKKEKGLNMAVRKFADVTEAERLIAQAAYDRTRTQLSREKILAMVRNYGLYPVFSGIKRREKTAGHKFGKNYYVLLSVMASSFKKKMMMKKSTIGQLCFKNSLSSPKSSRK
eukprot:TRINITY_DN7811_c0_g1_i11.p1 TRINITY_DN7811_c0_g1~~TRINITY_DN7811_c0_g1_i11.p1  ORF type:complete len:382 (-),score=74.28 TRINITY_DN7811_c0_g1_i11:756-1901(-)